MKSENIVLLVCFCFIFMVILGLLLQSCASTDRRSLSQVSTDRLSSMQSSHSSDSLSFLEVFSSQDKILNFTRREYAPVVDSAGRAVGSCLTSESTLSVTDSRSHKQTDATYQQLVDNSQSHSRDSTGVVSQIDIKKETNNFTSLLRLIPIMFVFFILATPFFRRS